MKRTPTLARISKAWQFVLSLLTGLSVMWGFGWFVYRLPANLLVVPSVLSVLVILPLAALAEWTRRREQKHKLEMIGKCPTCSYDLRAHRPGDKCPECGAVIAIPNPPPPV
jgi:hypothetical protein